MRDSAEQTDTGELVVSCNVANPEWNRTVRIPTDSEEHSLKLSIEPLNVIVSHGQEVNVKVPSHVTIMLNGKEQDEIQIRDLATWIRE